MVTIEEFYQDDIGGNENLGMSSKLSLSNLILILLIK